MTMENANLADPYTCTVRIMAPKGKSKVLCKIISPLTKWIDPSFQILQVSEGSHINTEKLTCNDENSDDEILQTPALSIMMFLSESGAVTYEELKAVLKKRPWKLHHKMELKSKISPDRTIGCQEFYGLADDMPLWSVCPIHCGNEHLRFLLHVRKFKEMVEFYRIITNAEMESSKPGFCIFQMYTQPGLDCQLALKYSKHIDPVPIENVILVFKVRCLKSIKASVPCVITQLDDITYNVCDPDGNKIQLKTDPVTQKPTSPGLSTMSAVKNILEDYKTYRSSSDSYDSGRFSDSDLWFSEAEQQVSENNKKLHYNINNVSLSGNKSSHRIERSEVRSQTNDACRIIYQNQKSDGEDMKTHCKYHSCFKESVYL
ncbi:protein FAM124A-like [Mytilus californianus]|uniref:protein FAM124A-like n=1 Tax=Mytilus californianus TaxID=6549 RepID=UPI0022471233|nr:protein FAM124A-like [Mytilus californianus]